MAKAKVKTLHDKLEAIIPKLRKEKQDILAKAGDQKISDVTIAQAFGGMRGVKGMICDTSVVEPDQGLIIRGYPLLKLKSKLPEEIFWLLITGKLPSKDELKLFQKQFYTAFDIIIIRVPVALFPKQRMAD